MSSKFKKALFKKRFTGESYDFLEALLIQGIEKYASDIHFESERDALDAYFRIDGLLYKVKSWAKHNQENVISRIKVLAQMNIMETRLPQDGHFEFNMEDKIYNIRVSTFPTPLGESVVLRLLNRLDMMLKLEDLGFDKGQLNLVNQLITSPWGMILTTGPTSSGKTTLLYTILAQLNKEQNNIVTVEDPVEYQMSHVRQMQVNTEIGLGFSQGMRAVLRQDPDIIMIGEIRDLETVQMVIQAALSGILVFSTFHTMDVPGLVVRLIEMGMPRSVVAQAMVGVISSRLIKKVCRKCKAPHKLTDIEKEFLPQELRSSKFYQGTGCDDCRESGYSGRIGAFEVVPFDEDISSAIIEKRPISEIYQILDSKGIKTLKQVVIEKAVLGETTIEEAIRVVGIL